MQKVIFLIVGIILSSCGQEEQVPDPAQSHIEGYTKDLASCSKPPIDETRKRDFSVQPDDIVLGDANGKVVVVEYFSPTCPHCAGYHKRIFPDIKAKYIDTKKIAYVLRECIVYKQDLEAAILARCKGGAENYLKFIEVILSQQNSWSVSQNYHQMLTNIAGLGGISPENFVKCLEDPEKTGILLENTKLVSNFPGFRGMPGFFINGEQFTGRYTVAELSAAIDKHLNADKNPSVNTSE